MKTPTRYCTAILSAVCVAASAQPVVTTEPPDKTAVWGDRITFSATFSSPLTLTYQWFFNTAPVPGGIISTLILTNVTFAQSGPYFVVATDSSGSVTSRVATLAVPAPVQLNPKVGKNIRLADPSRLPSAHRGRTEPHLSRSYSNPNLVITTCMEGTESDGSLACSYSVSTNGGLTWIYDLVPGLTTLAGGTNRFSADPVSGIDPDGNIFLANLGFNNIWGLFLSKSTDLGQSFSPTYQLAIADSISDPDSEWMAINTFPKSSTYKRIAVSYTMEEGENQPYLIYSDDGGATWSKPAPLPDKPVQKTQIAFLPDGSLGIFYNHHKTGNESDMTMAFILSPDGGATFKSPVAVQPMQGISYSETLAFNWSITSMTADRHAGVFYATFAALVGPTTNRVPQVLFTRSIDKGAHWSKPIAVNDTPNRRSVSYPTIAASPDGQHVTITFYDRRNQTATSNDYLYDLYLAESFDGGDTWEPNLRLTEVSSDLHKAPLNGGWRWVGDYQGIVPALNFDSPGFAAWVDTRFGSLDPFVVSIARSKGTTFDTWRKLRFPTNDVASSSISSENADPDGDGIPNIAEYAFGFEPNYPDFSPLRISFTHEGTPKPLMEYDRLAVLSDIEFGWESTTDLAIWTSAQPETETVTAAHDPTLQHVTGTFGTASETRFFRLTLKRRF